MAGVDTAVAENSAKAPSAPKMAERSVMFTSCRGLDPRASQMWGDNVTTLGPLRVFLLHVFRWTRANPVAISVGETLLRESMRSLWRGAKRKLKAAAMPTFLL